MTSEQTAENLRRMVEGSPSTAPETRSIENPALPVSPAQLEGIWGYGPTRSGVQINEQTALTFTAVFAAVRILSESIGMLPLAVFRGDDDEDVRIRAREHPAYQLLRWQPNPESAATVFKESVQANLVLWGNGYARIRTNNADEPVELINLESCRTHAERFGGQLRYVTEKQGAGGGGSEYFAPEEIIHIPGLSLNGVTGLSPVGYCREAIAMGKAAELFGATFYGNGAHVTGILETPGRLTPEQIAQTRESWNAMHAGPGNAFKTAVLQGGLKFTRTGIPPEEAQFLQSRKFQVTEIARIYRIPPHMLGEMERSTHSNIEQASLEFLIYTLLPWLEKWEQELTRKLCGTHGKFHVKFDDRRLLRTDITARQQFYQIGRQWGFLCGDEIRAMEGLAPLPHGQGQSYFAPVNMVPLDKFNQMPVPGSTPPASPAADDSAKEKSDQRPAPASGAAKEKAAAATRSVFEDAIARMLRKEANAAARDKADEAFYQQHRQHVREALYPAARTLLALTGRTLDAKTGEQLLATLDQFAAQRHGQLDNLPEIAMRQADEVIAALLGAIYPEAEDK